MLTARELTEAHLHAELVGGVGELPELCGQTGLGQLAEEVQEEGGPVQLANRPGAGASPVYLPYSAQGTGCTATALPSTFATKQYTFKQSYMCTH